MTFWASCRENLIKKIISVIQFPIERSGKILGDSISCFRRVTTTKKVLLLEFVMLLLKEKM